MNHQQTKSRRRGLVTANYLLLTIMNVCFYFAVQHKDLSHVVDVVGILAIILVGVTFVRVHWKSGLWKFTHADTCTLDERELQIMHNSLYKAYGWFSVICLTLMMAHAVMFSLLPGMNFVITVPLAVSLIYFAHTLPGSILAWTENEVPGEPA